MERNYEFRKRLLEIHQKNRRDPSLLPAADELVLNQESDIYIPADAGRVLLCAARDLQDYLFTSMGLSVRVLPVADLRAAAASGSGRILFATRGQTADRPLLEGDGPRGFRVDCAANVVITGFDESGAMQGGFYLEDLMNFRRSALPEKGDLCPQTAVFAPDDPFRIRTGQLPGPAYCRHRPCRHGRHPGLCQRCRHDRLTVIWISTRSAGGPREYGVDVYAYSYLVSDMHPDDPEAKAYYDKLYGSVFKACPSFKGIVMVGESVEFPSRDPHTTGKSHRTPSADGLPNSKPTPGWWPCEDYPQWLTLVRDTVRSYKPDADIVFWTYNWGYVEESYRLALLDHLPTDISLLVTFEMFEKIKTGAVTSTCVDYTLMF